MEVKKPMDLAGLIGGPGNRAVLEANQRLIDATSADNECEHGKLPTDRIQTCDCWYLESIAPEQAA